jgi:hypothetical protein
LRGQVTDSGNRYASMVAYKVAIGPGGNESSH